MRPLHEKILSPLQNFKKRVTMSAPKTNKNGCNIFITWIVRNNVAEHSAKRGSVATLFRTIHVSAAQSAAFTKGAVLPLVK